MTIKYWWECGLVIICYPLECNLSSQVKLLWLCCIYSLQLHLTWKKHQNLLLCICIQTVLVCTNSKWGIFWLVLKCFDTCGNIWSLDRFWEKSNIFLNIKLSGRHITEIWLPEQPLKPPGRAAPGSSELAALKLALTLHLHGRSEAPCSETPHLNATTSEAGPPLRVERTACFASRINTCVCCCCFLFDWCFFCARSSVFLHQRSTSSSLSLPVTLTFQLGLPSAFLSISLLLQLADNTVYVHLPVYLHSCQFVWQPLRWLPLHLCLHCSYWSGFDRRQRKDFHARFFLLHPWFYLLKDKRYPNLSGPMRTK